MYCGQVAQDQLEAVLRCAGQLRIRGLESELSRESSLEPDTRPTSQMSGSSKRKTSPKFHFLKNRRKCLLPSKFEEQKQQEETVQDDEVKSINDDETEVMRSVEGEPEGPVDFTIKNEALCSSPELAGDKEVPDISGDMVAFLASASAAVRNAGHFQVKEFLVLSSLDIFCG